jgi:hypothetical protein
VSHLSGHRLGSKFPRHAKIIAAKEMLPEEYFNRLYKFAFVRNPWDLQVSSFHHIRRERPRLMEGIDDFTAFIRWKLDPSRAYQYHLDTSIEIQSDYLVDLYGRIIVDYVGRYERLQEDFDEVCRHLGIATRRLPHRRKASDRDDYRRYYSDETAQLVGEHFHRDIENFSYTF